MKLPMKNVIFELLNFLCKRIFRQPESICIGCGLFTLQQVDYFFPAIDTNFGGFLADAEFIFRE